eukprot:1707297-Rhodomonas_salina.1
MEASLAGERTPDSEHGSEAEIFLPGYQELKRQASVVQTQSQSQSRSRSPGLGQTVSDGAGCVNGDGDSDKEGDIQPEREQNSAGVGGVRGSARAARSKRNSLLEPAPDDAAGKGRVGELEASVGEVRRELARVRREQHEVLLPHLAQLHVTNSHILHALASLGAVIPPPATLAAPSPQTTEAPRILQHSPLSSALDRAPPGRTLTPPAESNGNSRANLKPGARAGAWADGPGSLSGVTVTSGAAEPEALLPGAVEIGLGPVARSVTRMEAPAQVVATTSMRSPSRSGFGQGTVTGSLVLADTSPVKVAVVDELGRQAVTQCVHGSAATQGTEAKASARAQGVWCHTSRAESQADLALRPTMEGAGSWAL